MTPTSIEQLRFNMVEQQIRTWEVLDTEILDLLHEIHREDFVPPEQRAYAFMDLDTPLAPVSMREKMWAPKLEARVLQELELEGQERVLEVGTGSGYFTALLAARSAHVTSVEIDPALSAFASQNLQRAGVGNVSLHVADAARGFAPAAPYDAIVFTGSMEIVPEEAMQQLKPGGKLFVILGKAPVMTATLLHKRDSGIVHRVGLFETLVAPLVHAAREPGFVF